MEGGVTSVTSLTLPIQINIIKENGENENT